MSTILHMPSKGESPHVQREHIAVIVPCLDKPHVLFTHSITYMFYFCGKLDLPLMLIFQSGSAIQKVRNLAMGYLEKEVETKYKISHILWLDSDVTFPEYTLHALLRHDKDIVGCSYVRRTKPYDVLGRTLESKPIDTKDCPTLVEMAALPTGCLLVRREVFFKLKKPYFRMPWIEEQYPGAGGESEFGEDYYFCSAARAEGYKIWLDVQLTKLIGHVSERPLFPEQDSYPELREAANAG